MTTNGALARSYLAKARVRLRALAVFVAEEAHSDVIREAQGRTGSGHRESTPSPGRNWWWPGSSATYEPNPLTSEDQAFRDRYRPWGKNERGFQVTAHVALEDDRNRRVELVQDLDSRVADVRDAVLPDRDYADEIDHDGAPDGSRWLGLTRDNFLRTAASARPRSAA